MAQGEVGRFVELPLKGLFGNRLLQDGHQRGVCQGLYEFCATAFLRAPLGGIVLAVDNA